jgi:hypothetical protein
MDREDAVKRLARLYAKYMIFGDSDKELKADITEAEENTRKKFRDFKKIEAEATNLALGHRE